MTQSLGVGEMRVYPDARPRLSPGRHHLTMNQTITKGGPVAPVDRWVDVTAPRFTLAPGELLSTFPPANSVGAFDRRLPQVTFRRRTLPWERSAGGPATGPPDPWLALVVLAEGEANFRSGVHISDAVPANIRSTLGITEDGTCDVLEVSRTVIRKVFPAKEELPLLTHVREVNLTDTEFATGDDDGFIAVVIANRLPRPNTSYGAYLISLEGRRAELPETPGVQGVLGDRLVFDLDASQLAAASYARNPDLTMPLGATRDATPGVRAAASASGWTPASNPASPAVTGPAQSAFDAGFFENAVDFQVVEGTGAETTRFPVLAHWNFECDAGGDFESLMRGLDIGLLGSVSETPGEAGASVDTGPQVAPTGHTVLRHLTRRGESTEAWYRGALTPREVKRREAGSPFHAADQARRIAEDGLEDLSESAAFEIGRLLAMATPRFLADLAYWRRTGFAVRRARAILESMPIVSQIGDTRLVRRLKLALIEPVATGAPLGRPVPVDDVADLLADDDAKVIATGLGFDTKLVSETLADGLVTKAVNPAVTATRLPTDLAGVMADGAALDNLSRHVQDVAHTIVERGSDEH
jgi:hypothetical protein